MVDVDYMRWIRLCELKSTVHLRCERKGTSRLYEK